MASTARGDTPTPPRDGEDRVRALVERAGGVLYIFRQAPERRYEYISPGCAELYGYADKEFYDDPALLSKIIYPADRGAYQDAIDAIGVTPSVTLRFIRKDGRIVWVEQAVVRLHDGQGQTVNVQGIAWDVTEAHAAQARLQTRERQQAAISELSRMAIMTKATSPLFARAAALVAETLGVEFGAVLELKPDGKSLVLRSGAGWDEARVTEVGVDTQSQAGFTLLSEKAIIAEDLLNETRFSVPAVVRAQGAASGITVVIHTQGKPFGVLGAHAKERRRFSPDDVQFMQAVANVLGTSVERVRAAERLEESERQFRLLAQQGRDMVYLYRTGPAPHYEYVSPACEEIFGYPPDAFYADRLMIEKHVHPEDQAVLERLRGEGRRPERQTNTWTIRIIHRDGSTRWIESRRRAIRDEQGNGTAVQGVIRDVTEARALQGSLAENEERFRMLAEQATDWVYRLRLHPRPHMEYSSPSVVALTGYTAEEFAKDPGLMLRMVHREDRAKFAQLGAMWDTRTQALILRIVRKDGVVRWTETRRVPILDEKGEVIAIQGVGRDITELKEAEEALRAANRRMNLLFENFPGLAIEIGADRRVRMVRGKGLNVLGRAQHYLDGVSIDEMERAVPGIGGQDVIKEAVDRALAGESLQFTREAKGLQWLTNYIPVHGPSGEVESIFGISMDVTRALKAEQELRESEARFRALIENAADLITVVAVDGAVRYMSPSVERVLGYGEGEHLARLSFQRTHPEDSAAVNEALEACRNDPALVRTVEFRVKHADGSWRALQATIKNLLDNPAVGGFVINARDVTARREAEMALRESQRTLSTLMSNLPGMAYRRAFDAAWTMEFVSDGCRELTGYPPQDIIGNKRIAYDDLIHAADRAPVAVAIRSAVELGRPYQLSYRLITANGAEKWLWEQGSAVLGPDGKVAALEGFALDITERRSAEEMLRVQQELNERVLASTPSAMLVVDDSMRIVLANQSFRDAFHIAEDATGMRADALVPFKNFSESVSRAFREGRLTGVEFNATVGSEHKIFNANLVRMRSGRMNREPPQVFIGMRDVTLERAAQQQMYHTSRLSSIGQMAAGVAHELNNPLTSVLGYAQFLEDADLAPDLKDDVRRIKENAERAASVVRSLLTFARPGKPTRELLDIPSVVSRVLDLRAYEMRVNNIQATVEFAPDMPKVVAEPSQLEQVFLNVVTNAEQAMLEAHGKGMLTIRGRLAGSMVRIAFADDGTGIKEEYLHRLFDPFFTTKDPGKGTGLGLSICHSIVTGHGGRIYAESVAGKGATITIELPAAADEDQSLSAGGRAV